MTASSPLDAAPRNFPAADKRLFGRWLDFVLFASLLVVAYLLFLYAFGDGRGAFDGTVWFVFGAAVIVAAFYNQIWMNGTTGGGVGKRTAGTKVLDITTGQPIGIPRTVLRELLAGTLPLCLIAHRGYLYLTEDPNKSLSGIGYVGAIAAIALLIPPLLSFSDPKGRGLHDKLAKSVVVRDAWRQPELVRSDAAAARASLADVSPTPGSAKPDPILVAKGISRSFGGLKAVDVEHLEIQRGVITALIGPNGAGKTTLFNLLTSFDKPTTGTKSYNGDEIDTVPAHKIANYGMVRTFQLTKSLSKMSVMENMKLGATDQRGEGLIRALAPGLWARQDAEIEARAVELLERFNMIHMRDEFAGTLSGGQRKLLEMARALMVNPSLVMLDEPMAGVNPALKQSLLDHVKGLRDEGMTVVFVEHDMDMVQDISDWVVVMAEGQIIAEGPPAAISQNPAVIDAYLGSSHDSALQLEDEA